LDPSLEVDVNISEWNVPPLYRSIVTFSLILSVQVMFCVVPALQLSLPFGDVTVMLPSNISKLASEKSKTDALSTLVIFTV